MSQELAEHEIHKITAELTTITDRANDCASVVVSRLTGHIEWQASQLEDAHKQIAELTGQLQELRDEMEQNDE